MSNDNLPPLPQPAFSTPFPSEMFCITKGDYYTADQVRQCQRDAVAASGASVPDVVREAIEAAFECREGWMRKIASAVRALAAAPTPDRAPHASTAGEPVAWMHTLHQECDQQQSVVTQSPENAFGTPGHDYSASYEVTIEPLYDHPAPAIAPAGEAVTDERRGGTLYEAAMRACDELPDGYQIHIELENGCGLVRWYDDEGNGTVIESEGYLCSAVDEAFEAILAKSKGGA